MSGRAENATLQAAEEAEWRLRSKIVLFISLVGVLGLLQLWVQWAISTLAYMTTAPVPTPPVSPQAISPVPTSLVPISPLPLLPLPAPSLSDLVADGSVFFYSLALYFATLYGVLTFRDHRVRGPLMTVSLLTGLFLVFTVASLASIDTYEYYHSNPHAYPFPVEWFAFVQGACALASLSYALICTLKLERALAIAPRAPAEPIEQQS